MKRSIYILYAFLFATVIVFLINNFFTQQMISGKYVNRNFEINFISENPHIEDTLLIFRNNKFISKFYGKGNYELFHSFDGTYIELNYKDKTGENSFSTSINRQMFFGKPKISLCEDLNQYYEKID